MKINLCGTNNTHDKSFIVNRPNGSGDNLFIYTRTPVILIYDGKMNRYPAETTVFFRKGLPQHFMAAGHVYSNAYIHFDADEEEMAFIDSLEIPHATPFVGLDSSVFMKIQAMICNEYFSSDQHRNKSIDLLLEYFMIKLAQSIKDSISVSTSDFVRSAMQELRSEIYADVEKEYTIENLASRVGLSASYFQSIYKKMFGKSCMADIIFARIERARTLLLTTNYPISTIARLCGYENDSHFSRQFKKIVGITASDFRKANM